jgi:hypothetical protein
MGSIISGIGSLIGGQQASSYDKAASDTAKQVYSYTRSDLSPYTSAGQSAMSSALSLAQGSPTGGGPDYVTEASQNLPGTMTQSELEKTPGYQWNLAQGLKATQSAAAARGLGVSGASLKGASTYATNLADSTYQNQFNNAQSRFTDYLSLNTGQQSNLTNQFNRLNSLATIGEQAGTSTAYSGSSLASTSATAQEAAGNALAQGTKGLATGVGNTVNDLLGYNLSNTSTGATTSGY